LARAGWITAVAEVEDPDSPGHLGRRQITMLWICPASWLGEGDETVTFRILEHVFVDIFLENNIGGF